MHISKILSDWVYGCIMSALYVFHHHTHHTINQRCDWLGLTLCALCVITAVHTGKPAPVGRAVFFGALTGLTIYLRAREYKPTGAPHHTPDINRLQ